MSSLCSSSSSGAHDLRKTSTELVEPDVNFLGTDGVQWRCEVACSNRLNGQNVRIVYRSVSLDVQNCATVTSLLLT